MPGRQLFVAVLLAFVIWPACGAAAGEVDPPITVSVTIIDSPRNRRVVGELVSFDEVAATLIVEGERQRFPWRELTPTSCFTARHRLIDEDDAGAWLALARFGRRVGAERQAEYAIKKALRLDAALEAEVAAIREIPLGELRQAGVVPDADPVEPAETADEAAPEVILDPAAANLPPKFLPVTPHEANAAEQGARDQARQAAQRLGIRMREVTTPHFLIFTDWEPVDDAWLAEQLEGAYALLCREFNVPPNQPVFVGRLPVYMFHDHATMLRYARTMDSFPTIRPSVAGYFSGRSDGLGKLVMSKPQASDRVGLPLARQMWARTLTHEFVHAFLARYRGNGFLPRWMNEGLAEMLAETIMPRPNALATARAAARSQQSIADIFDDAQMPEGEMYPVMMTLVIAMYREDPARFVRMVDRVKSGENCERVVQELYNVDYAGLEEAWRAYMLRN